MQVGGHGRDVPICFPYMGCLRKEVRESSRVYLGLATPSGVESRQLDIGPEQPRDIIQRRSAKLALNWVRLTLMAWPGRT